MSNYVRNFGVKNYLNQTTIPQLIANNMSGCFFLKHSVLCLHCCLFCMSILYAYIVVVYFAFDKDFVKKFYYYYC